MKPANALVAHGGGPTSVLNATLAGVVEASRAAGLGRLWAPIGGLAGIDLEPCLDLLGVSRSKIARGAQQCGSLIGSYRGAVAPALLDRTLEFIRKHEVRYFLYAGGNGSMGTAFAMAAAARERGYELATVGIPKTVDNDICGTDHCPGFGSAARFVSVSVREMGIDQRALPTPVSIVEVMGRNAGWLAASSLLAAEDAEDPPHFIYVPERPFAVAEFLDRVDRLLTRQGWVVGVVAEGLRDSAGRMVAASAGASRDARGRPLAGNVAAHLARLVSKRLNVRARSEKPGLLCRAFSLCQSPVDAAEARAVGKFAVTAALQGHSGVMVAIRRSSSAAYAFDLTLVPLDQVRDRERRLPLKYLRGPAGVREAYRDYGAPLIGPALAPTVRL